MLPTLAEIETAQALIGSAVPPTPQFSWPLLNAALGAETWVKHENHTAIGAFKIRGGLVYFADLAAAGKKQPGVISATRGNHGQSIAFAARRFRVPATIVVPHGNSREKNASMRALGAELIEHGGDFQEAREHAQELAQERSLRMLSPFHPLLVRGVATYSLELLGAINGIDTVYVPIGMGSGICGMIAVRNLLGLATDVVGVVSSHATAYADSLKEGRPVDRPATTRLADGMAVRSPDPDALEIIRANAVRIVQVDDDEIGAAMRLIYECTHNVAEGAGAAAVAAAMKERHLVSGRRIAVILSGGNVDRDMFTAVLNSNPQGDPT